MKHPTFDEYGYPTEETLQAIREWPYTDAQGLMGYCREAWSHYGAWECSGRTIRIHTGGWSGNESIVEALGANFFWALYWVSSRRGGHYELELPEG